MSFASLLGTGTKTSGSTHPSIRASLVEPLKRKVLWTLLVFTALYLAIHGVRDITSDPPSVVSGSTQAQMFPADDMRSRAMRFARAFLTTIPGHPERQEEAVAKLLSPELRSDAAINMPSRGGGARVLETSVISTERVDRDRALVTVECVMSHGPDRYLAVTVMRDDRGGLLVSDYPAFVSPPPSAAPPDPSKTEQALMGADADPIERLLTDFFAEYMRGGVVSPVFLTPGAFIAPLGQGFDHVESVSLATAGPTTGNERTVLQVLNARDVSSKIGYTLRYRVRVARATATDRWLVNSIQGDPSR